ncbi:hypothetical protein OH492_14235 [Vibrio chagasii]|nr:hypothetical protein [Vibrio chagasii]
MWGPTTPPASMPTTNRALKTCQQAQDKTNEVILVRVTISP